MTSNSVSILSEDLTRVASDLRELATKVEAVQLTPIPPALWSFNEVRSSAQEEMLLRLAESIGVHDKSRFIYVFDLAGEVDTIALRAAYKAAKSAKVGDRKFAKLSGGNGTVMYVGSSMKLMRRTSEHLGLVAATVFAMHLRQWLPAGETRVRLSAFRVPDSLDDDVVQAIEDGMWHRLQPILGRRGAR